ncbi:hypothetical protein JZO78_14935 [Enterococcus ureilyticus]|uniref:hypothetical protein n=1 Tax=Enterococcus ureilyticus TaxID=1131292 RepID=UPI001A9188C4|nr:hypothetical protein [Enterococcus ureilyticus]MBO0447628.1 hypothetical protein [Enterococcus ureilyticus]
MKNKKNFIVTLISVALVAIIGGWLFVSSNKKTYNSFPDIFKTMDVSTKSEKSNTETQNLIYSPEENELSFIKMNSADLPMPDEKKIKNIAEEDSFDKVINELGEPDSMKKDGNGLIVLIWRDTLEKGYESLSIELKDNKVTNLDI